MNNELYKLLAVWDSDLKVFCHGHYEAATALDKKHYFLGVPIIMLSAVVGTSIFATLSNEPHIAAKITVGIVSMFVAVLGSLQTFLKFSERAEKHREAGARFGSLLKEIEQYQAVELSEKEFLQWSNNFRSRWDELSVESPTIPPSIFHKHHQLQKKSHNKSMQRTYITAQSADVES